MIFIKNILLLIAALFCFKAFTQDDGLSVSRLNQLSGERVQQVDPKTKWDQRYNKRVYIYGKQPAKFLAENFSYLRPYSKVLDMGMGEGRNAVFLAAKGHHVTGIDISSVAIKKAKKLAKENNVKIETILGTLDKYKIPKESFDVIICFYYVNRGLNKKMISWLKPGGIIIYEAYTLSEFKKPKNKNDKKEYFLESQELLKMFPNMKVLKYEEPQHVPEYRASIILQKKG